MTATAARPVPAGPPRSVAVVGASLAGSTLVRELCDAGFDGELTVIGEEGHRPYDRPPLSKEVLGVGEVPPAPPLLLPDDGPDGVRWRLGTRATGLARTEIGYEIAVDQGEPVQADAVVVATGARARRLMGDDLPGVHALRSLDDAIALRADLAAGDARRVVVVGAGFIGGEVAGAAAAHGAEVTIVEASPAPLAGVVGRDVARWMMEQHRAHGVTVRTGTALASLDPDPTTGRVASVSLGDGSVLPAEVVVVGIGALPNTEWAAASGLALDDGFVADHDGSTAMPRVHAIGDCARVYDPITGASHRHEHWSSAVEQARRAARSLLGLEPTPPRTPWFWTDQYGHTIQVAGSILPGAERSVTGELGEGAYLARHGDGVLSGVVAVDAQRAFVRCRKELDAALADAWR